MVDGSVESPPENRYYQCTNQIHINKAVFTVNCTNLDLKADKRADLLLFFVFTGCNIMEM